MDTVFHFINTERYRLALGQVDASAFALVKGTEKRNLEKEQVALLFAKLDLDYSLLQYDSKGKPLYPGVHLSISHSAGWFALAVSEDPIGMDIEFPRANLAAGSSYFVNSREVKINDLLAIWTAKEAFFKLLGGKIDDLKENVEILEATFSRVILQYYQQKFTGDLYQIDSGYCTVFCTQLA